jgi:hypothetical protein
MSWFGNAVCMHCIICRARRRSGHAQAARGKAPTEEECIGDGKETAAPFLRSTRTSSQIRNRRMFMHRRKRASVTARNARRRQRQRASMLGSTCDAVRHPQANTVFACELIVTMAAFEACERYLLKRSNNRWSPHPWSRKRQRVAPAGLADEIRNKHRVAPGCCSRNMEIRRLMRKLVHTQL